MSDGKFTLSVTIRRRPGRSFSAPAISLKRLTDVRVGDDHLVGSGADQAGELAADTPRKPHPLVIPGPYEPVSPLMPYQTVHQGDGVLRNPSEGIAVQVYQTGVVDQKAIPEPAQFIAAVQFSRVLERRVEIQTPTSTGHGVAGMRLNGRRKRKTGMYTEGEAGTSGMSTACRVVHVHRLARLARAHRLAHAHRLARVARSSCSRERGWVPKMFRSTKAIARASVSRPRTSRDWV